jgi:pSer/pThr/pTyr-binding forkhead associated (FHA) protein
VPPFVLTVLKVVFLAILYFFVYRSVRAVASDVRAGGRATLRAEGRPGGAARAAARAPGKGRPPGALVLLDARGGKGKTNRLDGNVQIGRSDACQIKVDDTYASAFHARLFQRDGAWFVEDLGSTNGTYLNQRKVTSPAEVFAGDQIRIGKAVLEFKR